MIGSCDLYNWFLNLLTNQLRSWNYIPVYMGSIWDKPRNGDFLTRITMHARFPGQLAQYYRCGHDQKDWNMIHVVPIYIWPPAQNFAMMWSKFKKTGVETRFSKRDLIDIEISFFVSAVKVLNWRFLSRKWTRLFPSVNTNLRFYCLVGGGGGTSNIRRKGLFQIHPRS